MANLFFVGAGGFGIALGVMAQREGHSVTLWAHSAQEAEMLSGERENKKLLPGVILPPDISITTNFSAVPQADAVIIVTPSHAVRAVSRQLAGVLPERALVVCASKGLEAGSNRRMSEVMAEELPHCCCVILSGPSHAEEVTRDVPTAVVAAGRDRDATELAQELLSGRSFRVYCNDDVAGVELGGALKNVIALAAGIVDGLGMGDNAKAALMTRGLTEIARLGLACGARSETFAGLSGMGDLIVTCTSRHSRNRSAGLLIGGGKTAQQAMDEVGKTVEGYICTRAAHELSRQLGIDMPITAAVYDVLYAGGSPADAAAALMGRPKRHESESIWPV